MDTYTTVLNILDKIKGEAPSEFGNYRTSPAEIEKINQARARAYIHLYLKSSWGILDFKTRESFVTDGAQDGGIDGYFIDQASKSIYFIQSKFRTTEANFQQKEIDLAEILKMDVSRVLDGETSYENGASYNTKILEMQEKIRSIPNIGRYRYMVVILANLSKIPESKLRLLTSGLPCEIYDYKRTLSELVFPIVTGTYYNNSDLNISVNLSNKSAGAKINYSVETELGTCDITVLFVPLTEIGKMMYAYKNSILKYNPRSYLALREGSFNDEIRQTILNKDTNEFALFNNGITILSDETFFNERIGQKDKAQLSLKNPQIINGGQTAFTMSLVYEESLEKEPSYRIKLDEKEVLVKVITFSLSNEIPIESKLNLIEAISGATNKQSEVNSADRISNNPLLITAQKILFTDFGLLLERKRGEFFDGLRYGYIDAENLVERGNFMRVSFASIGYPNPPLQEKKVLTPTRLALILNEKSNFKKYFFGCLCYREIMNTAGTYDLGNAKSSGRFAVISLCSSLHYDEKLGTDELKSLAARCVGDLLKQWTGFEEYVIGQIYNSPFFVFNFNYVTQSYKVSSNFTSYYKSEHLPIDLNEFFFEGKAIFHENSTIRTKLLTTDIFVRSRYLTPEIIRNVQPLINPINWFDEKTKESISIQLSLDPRTINSAIKLITSKEKGYYISKYYK